MEISSVKNPNFFQSFLSQFKNQPIDMAIRLVILAFINGAGIWFVGGMLEQGGLTATGLSVAIGAAIIFINIVLLFDSFYALRWFTVGLTLLIVMVAYPTFFTIRVAFTNYSDARLLTRQQVLERFEQDVVIPAGATIYQYSDPETSEITIYRKNEDTYALFLYGDDGSIAFAEVNKPTQNLDPNDFLEGPPAEFEGYTRVPNNERFIILAANHPATTSRYGEAPNLLQLRTGPGGRREAVVLEKRFQYNESENTLYDGLFNVDLVSDEGIYSYPFQIKSPPYVFWQELSLDGQLRTGEPLTIFCRLTNPNLARPPLPADCAENSYALWLNDLKGNIYWATQNTTEQQGTFEQIPSSEFDYSLSRFEGFSIGIQRPDRYVVPNNFREYHRLALENPEPFLNTNVRRDLLSELSILEFGDPNNPIRTSDLGIQDANILKAGGYYVDIGFRNFERLLTNEELQGPFLRIFFWTLTHAFLAVFLTFWFGLMMAIVMNDELVPMKKILRSVILIPYAIPGFITILVWRGLLNPFDGVISNSMDDVIGWHPEWFGDPLWARVGILLIQLWLGYPYMLLITTGALQSISSEIYEAAQVDGANAFQRFRSLTLPLLLVAVGPLLIASYAYNFNNYTIIELFNEGNPNIVGSNPPAGHTDILITYTYQVAFGTGLRDYGLASAITIMIFLLVATITFFNFRFTRVWEETSKNV